MGDRDSGRVCERLRSSFGLGEDISSGESVMGRDNVPMSVYLSELREL